MRALVRRPGPRLGEGIVTHVPRQAVDAATALAQWHAYVRALEEAGWEAIEAPPADDLPDACFVEDAVVVSGEVAVLTRPGVEARREETAGLEDTLAALGFRLERIEAPGTLDGGDVLAAGDTFVVGVGGRTNAAGAAQLASLTGRPVETVAVPAGALHLKTAYTHLPDGTRIDANVLDLGGGRVLAATPDAQLVAARGYTPVAVDISEFAKVEGGVTCLSVPLPPS